MDEGRGKARTVRDVLATRVRHDGLYLWLYAAGSGSEMMGETLRAVLAVRSLGGIDGWI